MRIKTLKAELFIHLLTAEPAEGSRGTSRLFPYTQGLEARFVPLQIQVLGAPLGAGGGGSTGTGHLPGTSDLRGRRGRRIYFPLTPRLLLPSPFLGPCPSRPGRPRGAGHSPRARGRGCRCAPGLGGAGRHRPRRPSGGASGVAVATSTGAELAVSVDRVPGRAGTGPGAGPGLGGGVPPAPRAR